MAAGKLTLQEGTAPGTPAAGFVTLYPKSDGLLYWKDDAGTEYAVATGSGGITQLTGDVTAGPGSGSQAATVVSVGGQLAAAVATAATSVAAATASASSNTLVLRDASANAAFGTVTAALAGDVLFASTIGTVPVATVLSAVTDVGNATSSALSNTIVKRDGFANFAAGTITATLNGNANNISGIAAIANGGTGQSNAQAAINNLSNSSMTANNGDVFQWLGGNAQFAAYVPPGSTGGPNLLAFYDSTNQLTDQASWTVEDDGRIFGDYNVTTGGISVFRNNAYLNALDSASSLDLYSGTLSNAGTLTGNINLLNLNYNDTGGTLTNLGGAVISTQGNVSASKIALSLISNGTVGTSYTGINLSSDDDVSDYSILVNLNNTGVVTQGLTGVNMAVSDDVGDGSGVSLTGLNLQFQNTVTVDGSIFGVNMSNSAVISGNDNVYGVNCNNQGGGYSYYGMYSSNSANQSEAIGGFYHNTTGSSRTSTGLDITMSGNSTDDAQGIRANVTNQTSSTVRVRSLDMQGATYSYNGSYTPASSAFVDTGNNNFLEHKVDSGSPLTGTDCLINNNVVAFLAQDDISLGPISLGQVHSSSVSLLGVATGKTIDEITGMIVVATAQDPGYADAGAVTLFKGYTYAGTNSGGGNTTVGTAYGLYMPPAFDSYATNNWGIRVEGATADNYVNKLAVGTADFKTDSGYLVEVAGKGKYDDNLETAGNLRVTAAGKGLTITEGSNAKMGTATLVAGTVTVNTTAITANSRVYLTIQSASGSIGVQYLANVVAGTSFDIVSTNPADTSTVAWLIVEST